MVAGMAELRAFWFQRAVESLDAWNKSNGKEAGSIQVVNRSLDGDGELAAQAFQLQLVSQFASSQGYLGEHEKRPFISGLLELLCPQADPRWLEFYKRYQPLENTTLSNPLTRFLCDIYRHITNGGASFIGASCLGLSVQRLLIPFSHMLVAKVFGDEATARELDPNP
jgi:hypothetical protein